MTLPPVLPSDALDAAQLHPKVRRLYEYWQSIRPADRRLPGRQHFDPLDVPDLLPFLWMVDVEREPFRVRYRLVGTQIVEARKNDPTGRDFAEANEGIEGLEAAYRTFESIARDGVPNWRKGEPKLVLDQIYPDLERLFLPMASDGEQVDLILAITVFYRGQAIGLLT